MVTLTRPLVCLDTETTGVDCVNDRIIEFACTVYHPDGARHRWDCRVNPGIPIPKEASDVHGITDEMVADCPPFSLYAAKIHKGLTGRDIAGYTLRRLDLPILDEELRRCGLKLDLTGVQIIDAAGIFFKKEPRDLKSAVKKYCGREHKEAHGATVDADATLDVLLAQVGMYEDLAAMDLTALAAFSRMADHDYADLAGKLYRDAEGYLRYSFGKNKDCRVVDEPGFAYWMLKQQSPGFTGNTCEVLQAELAPLTVGMSA